jgi:small subunit ribosomal protein S1
VVLKIDRENEKFSLGIKQLSPNPWDGIKRKYQVGSEVTGEVASVAEFGAFVKLEEGIEGLIYTAELSTEKVENPASVVSAGQSVTALVTKVDPVEQKISLSIRALTNKEERAALKRFAAQEAASQTTTLGDLLKEKLGRKSEE